jgi:CheY-like chemotaxis protein
MQNDAQDDALRPEALGETVLVVEDDADVRLYTVAALQELGYFVIEAADGPAAIAILEKRNVDLVFTDVVLPGGMTGADVAARAAALWPGIKILFTTGYARNAIVHHGRLDRGVHLLTKPFSFDDLAAKVRDVIDKAR